MRGNVAAAAAVLSFADAGLGGSKRHMYCGGGGGGAGVAPPLSAMAVGAAAMIVGGPAITGVKVPSAFAIKKLGIVPPGNAAWGVLFARNPPGGAGTYAWCPEAANAPPDMATAPVDAAPVGIPT